MNRDRRTALISLAAAGALWGLTVPLSKLALGWLDGAWLAAARFGVAAPLLAFVARRGLRAALSGPVAAWGALGYGLVIVLQNAGIERTSVSHGALIVGAVPALVALISLARGQAQISRRSAAAPAPRRPAMRWCSPRPCSRPGSSSRSRACWPGATRARSPPCRWRPARWPRCPSRCSPAALRRCPRRPRRRSPRPASRW